MISVGQVLQIIKVTKHHHHHKPNPQWRESGFKAALRPRGRDPGCGQLQGSPALCPLLDPLLGEQQGSLRLCSASRTTQDRKSHPGRGADTEPVTPQASGLGTSSPQGPGRREARPGLSSGPGTEKGSPSTLIMKAARGLCRGWGGAWDLPPQLCSTGKAPPPPAAHPR